MADVTDIFTRQPISPPPPPENSEAESIDEKRDRISYELHQAVEEFDACQTVPECTAAMARIRQVLNEWGSS